MALLAGVAVSGMNCWWAFKFETSRPGNWPVWFCVVAVAMTVFVNREAWFLLTPLQAAKAVYGDDPFGEAEIVAKFIQGNSTPADRMAVIGSEPEIYFLARRHSATGYVYTYALMEPQPFARRMQGEMIGEVEASVPEFIVYAANPFSWARQPDSDQRIFEWWNSYQTNYIRVALSDVVSHADSEFRFGIEDAGRYGKIRGLGLEVFQRKSGANHP